MVADGVSTCVRNALYRKLLQFVTLLCFAPTFLPAHQAALQAHFSRPRLLLPGQVITCRQEDPESGRWLTACFRIESVEAATPETDVTAGLVGRGGVTSLYQVSDVTAAVPPPQPVRDCPWEPGQVPGTDLTYESLWFVLPS